MAPVATDLGSRPLGRTGLRLSALGMGCGNVGGLMIRGSEAERERALARAVELGVRYFDTAPSYGDGLSETHLGRALRSLQLTVQVGTKVRLSPDDLTAPGPAVVRSLEMSLGRLGLPRVDVLHLHNPVRVERGEGRPGVSDVLDAVVPALERLREQGKIGCWGLTALGDTEALHRIVGAGAIHSAQVFYNLLNPSAGRAVPRGFPGQDFQGLLDRLQDAGAGAMVVRVLAAGALSGAEGRHPVAQPSVAPLASGPSYAADVTRARALAVLVEEGHAESLVEAALRFPLSHPAVATVLLGVSDLAQLELAASAVSRGPLPDAALARLDAIWRSWAQG
jgi:aryl-alcohol dehydrogenase-like predicted oxidoreductase